MRAAMVVVVVAACGGSEPAPARPPEPTRVAAPADAGVAPDAFVFASLTGVGSGGMPPDAQPAPRASGDVDKPIIRRHIRTRIKEIQACYEKALVAKPTLEGTITVTFFIGTTGAVQTATASGVDAGVDRCIEAEIKQVQFPQPKGGKGVSVSYPFTFKQSK